MRTGASLPGGPPTVAPVAGVPESRFDARRGLRSLVGFGAFGMAVSGLYAATGLGFPCPLRLLTGWECPLCGGTRMGAALWHGDLAAAFAFNPVVLVGLVLAGLLGLAWIVEALGGPALRPPRRWQAALRRVRPTHWTLLAVGAGVVYTLIRNLG